jgi:large subunit ribosomal protein L25
MEKQVIKATKRDIKGKQVKQLRRQGKLPGVMYGHNFQPQSILMGLKETTQTLGSITGSSIVTISLDGKEHATLVREKQRDFIKGNLLHVDFQVVSLTEKIRTTVDIEFKGISPAVKDFNGVVVEGLDGLEVECFPQNLPERFVVDVSNLMKIGDSIHVKDIPIPENVEVLDNPDEMIVIITAAKEEEIVEPAVEEAAAAEALEEPEVIEKGKKEEELPEEGEAKPEAKGKPESKAKS